MTSEYLHRSFLDPSDEKARAQMILASTYAGIGFGNSGVHLCHGMSYPVAGLAHNLNFQPEGYPAGKSLIPHGMSVILHAPAVFRWTCSADPQRHLRAAQAMGIDISNVNEKDSGKILSDKLVSLMSLLRIPNGLSAVGYTEKDIPALVEGTIPQQRVTKLAPRPVDREALFHLFSESMKIY
eukprot:TRINITY_DN8556_c0_g1_i1.p1 TRINITY_DN8556_c0_g1~~TRINITY_DN8556_c0_g1_i1.p1  ORF type:complete len:182 (+),score=38.41 TRINITY_DN8556_c0_g1_i1:1688-2233(+)